MRRRPLVAVVGLVAVAAAAAALLATHGHATAAPPTRSAGPLAASSLAARFAVLRTRHSNRCGMPASALSSMPAHARLRGSCCFPMDYRAYVKQRRELARRYTSVDVIPNDPYDIPVSLAVRLVRYRSIRLTPAQQRIYTRAKPLSTTRGPCCCPCWRWTAFGGQAKYLITRQHYSAKQIGDVWSAEEGCGGPAGS